MRRRPYSVWVIVVISVLIILFFNAPGIQKSRNPEIQPASLSALSFNRATAIAGAPVCCMPAVSEPTVLGTSSETDGLAVGNTEGYNQGGFYAAGRYWTWYVSATVGDVMIASSTDGISWTAPSSLGTQVYDGSGFSGVFDGTYFSYVAGHGKTLGYRRGLPNSDGTITWSAAEQTINNLPCGTGDDNCDQEEIAVDSLGHAWVGFAQPLNDCSGCTGGWPYLAENANTDGTWSTASGFPVQLNPNQSTGLGNGEWGVIIVPLTGGDVGVLYSRSTLPIYGRLYTPSGGLGAETVIDDSGGGLLWNNRYSSAIAVGNTIDLVYISSDQAMRFVTGSFTGGWTSQEIKATTSNGYPDDEAAGAWPEWPLALTEDNSGNLYVFWEGLPTSLAGHSSSAFSIYYMKDSGGSWGSPVEWLTDMTGNEDPTSTPAERRNMFVFPQQFGGGGIGVTYEDGLSSPWTINFALFPLSGGTTVSLTTSGSTTSTLSKSSSISTTISTARTQTSTTQLSTATTQTSTTQLSTATTQTQTTTLTRVSTVTSSSTSTTIQTSTQTSVATSATPSITPGLASAAIGSAVSVLGSGFSASDISCSLSGVAVGTSTCSVSGGSLAATFVVANVGAGSYTITATGSPGGDSATFSFQVLTSGPSITLSPASASVGTTVTVSGSGFSTGDTSCSLSGSPIGSPSCLISGGALTASFVVANVGPASYTITATGSPASDSASTTLSLVAPSITLNPSAAQPGATVTVSGSGFYTTDTTCTLTGGGVAAQSCSISAGGLTGSFTVANAVSGTYLVTVVTSGADSGLAAAYLQVTNSVITTTTSTLFGTSTATQFSATTTTFTLTGISTTQSVTSITVTVLGQSTASVATASTITSFVTAASTTTQTQTTTTTHNLVTGMIAPSFDAGGTGEDTLGLLAALLMLVSIVVRKMFD